MMNDRPVQDSPEPAQSAPRSLAFSREGRVAGPACRVALLAMLLVVLWGIGTLACAQEAKSADIAPLVADHFGAGDPSEPYLPGKQTYIPGFHRDHFARAYLGDGLLGIRPNPNPLSQSETVAAGFVFSNAEGGFEMYAPAPYPLGTDLRVNGLSLLKDSGRLTVHTQTLDMESGELVTAMSFKAGADWDLQLKVTQFLARSVPSLMCQEIQVISSADGEIELYPEIQREGIAGTVFRDKVPGPRTRINQVLGLASDRGSKIGIALLHPSGEGLRQKETRGYVLSLKRGEPAIFRTLAAVVTDVYDSAPDTQAIRVASWGGMIGFDQLREQNRQAWKELWQSRIQVTGDEAAQKALDAAFFYVHSSVHPSLRTGVPPFGTSQWSDYAGHIFWDMDAWIMPAVLPGDPESAKAMIEYRYHGLETAEGKAASFGFPGAMYPWEAGVSGSETTPSWAETGWAEQHVVPEVAIAAWEYYEATGDKLFLHKAVWPIEREVAEWISHRGTFTKNGYEISNIMGPDEWVSGIKNAITVNLASKMAISDAVKAARAVGLTPPARWIEIEQAMFIPVDKQRQVLQPFSLDAPILYYNEAKDRYEPGDISQHPEAYTLGNVQFMVYHDPPVAFDLYRNTWKYEEDLRAKRPPTPSVPGSVRSPGFTIPPLAACAAMFGDRKKAAELIHVAATEYTLAPFSISKEYRPYQEGDYVTNQASFLMAAMYGFTGLRISSGDWRKYPVSLPEGWTRIEMQRIWIHGEAFHLIAEQGKPALLEPLAAREKSKQGVSKEIGKK